MTSMMEYFKKTMQQGVQEFDEEKENSSIEKEAVIKIHNIDNEHWIDVTVEDSECEKMFLSILFDIYGEVPDINKNSDIKTTEIYLNNDQIEIIIKKIENLIEKKRDTSMVELVNMFKFIL